MNAATQRTLLLDLYHATLNTVEASFWYGDQEIDEDDLRDFLNRVSALEDLVTRRMPRDLKSMLREALSRAKQFIAENELAAAA